MAISGSIGGGISGSSRKSNKEKEKKNVSGSVTRAGSIKARSVASQKEREVPKIIKPNHSLYSNVNPYRPQTRREVPEIQRPTFTPAQNTRSYADFVKQNMADRNRVRTPEAQTQQTGLINRLGQSVLQMNQRPTQRESFGQASRRALEDLAQQYQTARQEGRQLSPRAAVPVERWDEQAAANRRREANLDILTNQLLGRRQQEDQDREDLQLKVAAARSGQATYQPSAKKDMGDLIYDYVNGDTSAAKALADQYPAEFRGQIMRYRGADAADKGVFNYLYKNQGLDAAMQYMDRQERQYSPLEAGVMAAAQPVMSTMQAAAQAFTPLSDEDYKTFREIYRTQGAEAAEQYRQERVTAMNQGLTNYTSANAAAAEQHPTAANIGAGIANVAEMAAIGAGIAKLPGFGKLGELAKSLFMGNNVAGGTLASIGQGALHGAGSLAGTTAINEAGALATGQISGEDYLRDVAQSGIQGATGSVAAAGLGRAFGSFLSRSGLAGNKIAQTVAAGAHGAGFAAGDALARAGIDPNAYKDPEELAKDLLVGFAFGTISSLLHGFSRNPNAAQEKMTEPISQWEEINNAKTAEDLAKARRLLARQYHSDVTGESDAVMAEINAACDARAQWIALQTMNKATRAYRKAEKAGGKEKTRAAEEYRRSTNELRLLAEEAGLGERSAEAFEILEKAGTAGATEPPASAQEAPRPAESQTGLSQSGDVSIQEAVGQARETPVAGNQPAETSLDTVMDRLQIGETGRSAIGVFYDGSDVLDYTERFTKAYSAGKNGIALERVDVDLDAEARQAAWLAGRRDAQLEGTLPSEMVLEEAESRTGASMIAPEEINIKPEETGIKPGESDIRPEESDIRPEETPLVLAEQESGTPVSVENNAPAGYNNYTDADVIRSLIRDAEDLLDDPNGELSYEEEVELINQLDDLYGQLEQLESGAGQPQAMVREPGGRDAQPEEQPELNIYRKEKKPDRHQKELQRFSEESGLTSREIAQVYKQIGDRKRREQFPKTPAGDTIFTVNDEGENPSALVVVGKGYQKASIKETYTFPDVEPANRAILLEDIANELEMGTSPEDVESFYRSWGLQRYTGGKEGNTTRDINQRRRGKRASLQADQRSGHPETGHDRNGNAGRTGESGAVRREDHSEVSRTPAEIREAKEHLSADTPKEDLSAIVRDHQMTLKEWADQIDSPDVTRERENATEASHDLLQAVQRLDEPLSAYAVRAERLQRGGQPSALGIATQFIREGTLELTGTRLSGRASERAGQLAALAMVARDPRFETFRIFYTSGDEIIDNQAVTSYLTDAGVASFRGNIMDWFTDMRQHMTDIGADGYYLMHNHPSGNPKPSEADYEITLSYIDHVPGFKGHIVLDHNQYAHIDLNGANTYSAEFGQTASPDSVDFNQRVVDSPYLYRRVQNKQDLADMALRLLHDSEKVTLIFADSRLRVRAIQDVDLAFASGDEFEDYLADYKLSVGGAQAFAILNKQVDTELKGKLGGLLHRNVFTDVYSLADNVSFREDLGITPDDKLYLSDGAPAGSVRAHQVQERANNSDTPIVEVSADKELESLIESSDRKPSKVIADFLYEKYAGHTFQLSDGNNAIMDHKDAGKIGNDIRPARREEVGNLKDLVEKAIYRQEDLHVLHKKFSSFRYYEVKARHKTGDVDLWINVGKAKNDGQNHIYAITEKAPTKSGVPSLSGGDAGRSSVQSAFSGNNISSAEIKNNTIREKSLDYGEGERASGNSLEDLRTVNRELNKELRDLRNKLREQTKQKEYWKSQTKVTNGPKVRDEDVRRFSNRLVKDYGSKTRASEIEADVKALSEYAYAGGDANGPVTLGAVMSRARGIAKKVIDGVQELVDVEPEAEMIRSLIGKTMYISAQDANDIPDYDHFRKTMFGKMNLVRGSQKAGAQSVDSAYQELAMMYPVYFPEDISHPADQVLRMAEVLDQIRPIMDNPYDRDYETALEYVAEDIASGIIGESNRAVQDPALRLAPETYADRQQKVVEMTKRRSKEALDRARKQKAEAIEKLKTHNKEVNARQRERRHCKELRTKIEKHAKSMSQTLLRPTDKKHIPKGLQASAAKLLDVVNLESAFSYGENGERAARDIGLPTKRTQAFQELRRQYEKMIDDLVIDPDLLGTDGLFNRVIGLADKPLAAMNESELTDVWNAVRSMEGTIRSANKLFRIGRAMAVSDLADSLYQHNAGKKPAGTAQSGLRGSAHRMFLDMQTPEAYLHRLGPAGDRLFRALRNGQDKFITITKETADFSTKLGINKRKAEKEKIPVTLGGKDTELSAAQLMELYNVCHREQGLGHVLGSGILPEGDKKYSAVPIRNITYDELTAAFAKLPPAYKEAAEQMQQYVCGPLARHGNEASMEVYGYEKFGAKDYWPIRVNSQETKSDLPQGDMSSVSVANWGSAKQLTPNAKNSLRIGSVFRTFSEHTTGMASYAAYLAPQEDVNRIRNYIVRGDDGSVQWSTKEILNQVFGQGGDGYLRKLMSDIANGVQAEKEYFGGFTGGYKAAAVGANLRVIIQQPTSIARAGEMIGFRYLNMGLAMGPLKGWKKAKKYAPIAQWKDWGFFDINTGKQMEDILFGNPAPVEKVKSAMMAGAGAADSFAWGILWNACEIEMRAKNKALKPDTEEFYQRVAERFTEIVDHTQVVDGILQRSQIMRNPSGLAKMATSFMGEPIKQFNQMASAAYDARTDGSAKSKKRFGRTVISMLVAGAFNVAAQSLMDAERNDDKTKSYLEKWWNAFSGIDGTEEGLTDYFGHFFSSNLGDFVNPAQYIPYAKDIVSVLQGYSVDRMDLSGISDLVNAGLRLVKALNGEGKLSKENAFLSALADSARLFGIPVANLKREIASLTSTIANETHNYLLQYQIADFNYRQAGNKKEFMDILYNAYENDKDAYELIRADLIKRDELKSGDKSTEEYIDEQLKKRSKDEGEQYFSSPNAESQYNTAVKEVHSSKAWKSATTEEREKQEQILSEIAAGSKTGQKHQEKIDAGKSVGLTEAEYVTFLLALDVADRKNNANGSYNKDEIQTALESISGLSRKEKAYLFSIKSNAKNNPYN